MDDFRPEYLAALAAARWNLWLVPMFLAPPAILLFCFYPWRTCLTTFCATAAAMCATWICFSLYVEHYWETKSQLAQTDVEIKDATADTGRLFGPVLVGVPFAICYTLACLSVLATIDWMISLLRRRRTRAAMATTVEIENREALREALRREYREQHESEA